MLIGVPREIKVHEYRVGLTPASVQELVNDGHEVLVEAGAGAAIGFADESYALAGGRVCDDANTIFSSAQLIIKVKEPQPEECLKLMPGQILFTYLHLAADFQQADLLMRSEATAIAYETVTDNIGRLPLLAPMSEVAGRMSVQAGAHYLEKPQGGRGILLGGVPGVPPAQVLILGGGVVGDNAATIAVGMGAQVTILDKDLTRLRELDSKYRGRAQCLYSTSAVIDEYVALADLIIGAVLVPGATAPKLLTAEHIKHMQPGSVVVDVAIDQGGCFATSRPTTHQQPTYIVDDVIHYCVANMPGGVARTATLSLNNATLPYIRALAANPRKAMLSNPHLQAGVNVMQGKITCEAVAKSLALPYVPLSELMAN